MSVSASIEVNDGVNGNGKRRRVVALVSYASEAHSSGYALDKSLFGFQAELERVIVVSGGTTSERMYKWDKGNQTIRIFDEDGGGSSEFAEVTSSLTEDIRVEAIGH